MPVRAVAYSGVLKGSTGRCESVHPNLLDGRGVICAVVMFRRALYEPGPLNLGERRRTRVNRVEPARRAM